MKTNMPKAAVIDHWQILHTDPQKLKADAGNLHQAIQLVAMAGKYFIPETTNDSLRRVTSSEQIWNYYAPSLNRL